MTTTHTHLTRRQFLSGAAALAAGMRVSPAWAQPRVSANEKIHLGFIGVGGMGRSHYNRLVKRDDVRIIAVADPDAHRREDARKHAEGNGQTVQPYNDFREMLQAHPDIDAVFVSTPDHWHAAASIACIKAGKDVYCEKPLTLTIEEGRALVQAARRYGRVVQMGTMQRSDWPHFRHACGLVQNGRIGALEKVVCFFGANPRADFVPNEPAPDFLDWDLYLGPAPSRGYNRLIHPYNFRYFRDYSGGMLTDWGVHLFDIAQWGMAKDHTGPMHIEAETEMWVDNIYEFPKTAHIRYDYGDVTLEWRQGTDDVVAGAIEAGQTYGTKFYGSEGEVFVNRGGYAARDKQGNAVNEDIGPHEIQLYWSTSHHDDFFQAMRHRSMPICDVEVGHRATSISHLGNIATRLNRPVVYDPNAEIFPRDPAANAMLGKPSRAPWRV
jgi:predicted dehydrogenase